MMTTVELFAGIGGFRLAADRVGIRTVWANDLCPQACGVYRDRFGDTELHEGDFVQWKGDIPEHDLLTAGFPCQPFSSAGKKQGIRDARGTLFQQLVEVIHNHRPRFFILENVKRLLTMDSGEHFAAILAALAQFDYTVEWRLLNAMHFHLAQNRERVIILGVRSAIDGRGQPLFGEIAPLRLASAKDLGCLDAICLRELFTWNEWQPIARHQRRFPNWGIAHRGHFFAENLEQFNDAAPPVKLESVLEPVVPEVFDFTEATLPWVGSNRVVNRFVNGVEILSNQRGGARMGYTIFGVNGVAPTLTSTTSRHYERYQVGDRYRRLTNVEYARLQGFPDDHCRVASVYDQYALYGNAVPPPLVQWVLSRLTTTGVHRDSIPRSTAIPTLFDHAV